MIQLGPTQSELEWEQYLRDYVMRDRSPVWIGIADLLLCVVSVVIVAVAPVRAKQDGVQPNAEFLIQMDYPIDRDIDLDLWVVGPDRKPVFYGSRQVGCADLDRDSLGLATSMVYLADGTSVRSKNNIETTTLRCIAPGHYDVAANLFSYHSDSREPIKAHIEITSLNPAIRTVWAGDVRLRRLGETINAVSFDLDKHGAVKLVDPPLAPLTQTFAKSSP